VAFFAKLTLFRFIPNNNGEMVLTTTFTAGYSIMDPDARCSLEEKYRLVIQS
jgi:hypothetical protein